MATSTELAPGEMFAYDDDFTNPWGRSESVLLQHGMVRNGSLWRTWVPYLGRRFRVLRTDLPGIGRSPDPGPEYSYTTVDLIDQTLRLLDRLDINRVHYVGEGLGGAIGAAIAGEHPDRIASLTLISEPVRVGSQIKNNHAVGFPTWEEAILTLGMKEWWIRAHTAAKDLVGDAAVDDHIANEVAKVSPRIAIALARWAATWDLNELLPKVRAPALFIWAEGAHFVDEGARAKLVALARNGRCLIIPKIATQLLHYIYPDIVAPEVAKFINEHAERETVR